MSQRITILIGTMTGNAELVADDVTPLLEADGFEVLRLDMDGLGPEVFGRDGLFLLCVSTYGQGDVPDNAMALYEALGEARPDLSGVRYGIIGLGDSTYADTFNHGPERFDRRLQELGARRLGERMVHDASGDEMPEIAAVAWMKDWLGQLNAIADAA